MFHFFLFCIIEFYDFYWNASLIFIYSYSIVNNSGPSVRFWLLKTGYNPLWFIDVLCVCCVFVLLQIVHVGNTLLAINKEPHVVISVLCYWCSRSCTLFIFSWIITRVIFPTVDMCDKYDIIIKRIRATVFLFILFLFLIRKFWLW